MITHRNGAYLRPIAEGVMRALPSDRLGQRGLFADYELGSHRSFGTAPRAMVEVLVPHFSTGGLLEFSRGSISSRVERLGQIFRPAGISMRTLVPPAANVGENHPTIGISLRSDIRRKKIGCVRLVLVIIAMAEDRLTWMGGLAVTMRSFKTRFFKEIEDAADPIGDAIDILGGIR